MNLNRRVFSILCSILISTTSVYHAYGSERETSIKVKKGTNSKQHIQHKQFDPGSISINLKWINKKENHCDYIFPKTQLDTVKKTASNWKQNYSNVNFWYDSTLISSDALHKTRNILNFVSFKDIRELQEVKEKPEVFSADIPYNFKAPLLSFIIAQHCLRERDTDTFVYADWDVQPEDKKTLFDQQTVNFLTRFGFVLLRNDQGPDSHPTGGLAGFEDKFMIARKKKEFLKAIDQSLIKPSLIVKDFIKNETEKIFHKILEPLIKNEKDKKSVLMQSEWVRTD